MTQLDRNVVCRFLDRCGPTPEDSSIRISPLQGGLESAVAYVEVAGVESHAAPRRFVVKRLEARQRHEVHAYELLQGLEAPIAPALLGMQDVGDACYLFIDWVASGHGWPWSDLQVAESVILGLARLHAIERLPPALERREYERSLAESAHETLEIVERLADRDLAGVSVRRWSLRRFVRSLCAVRHVLMREGPLPTCFIHGDPHPGNALLDPTRGDAVLVDWGRARLGSPFEDASCWLQSLGLWEACARQRHDRLLTAYLRARGLDGIDVEVRDHYWLAAGCNALGGALRYHVVAAQSSGQGSEERTVHAAAAARWMAIVRRADALWRKRFAAHEGTEAPRRWAASAPTG